MNFDPKFSITNRATMNLAAIERARGFLDAATLSEAWVRRMSQQALLLEAHHTTHIEGTQLTIDQSKRIWAGEDIQATSKDDVRELLNYRDAFTFVSEYLESGAPITEALIREIHRRLVQKVRGGEAQPGEWRKVQNYVANVSTGEVLHTPPPPGDVAPLMHELVTWLSGEHGVHPVLVAGIAQFQLVDIHPFVDGNGRTSRLLSTLCLYREGYDFKRLFTISEFYDRDRPAFYAALQAVRTSGGDLTGWLEYFTDGLATQLKEVKSRGERAVRAGGLALDHGLNERQQSLATAFIEHKRLSLSDCVAMFPDTSRRTLQRDLKNLVDRELVRNVSQGPHDPTKHYAWIEV